VKERVRDKLSKWTNTEDPEDYFYMVEPKIKCSAKFKLPFDESIAGQINGDTVLTIELGGFRFEGQVSDDVRWEPGREKASWVLRYPPDEDTMRLPDAYMTVKASWKDGRLKVKVKTVDGWCGESFFWADEREGSPRQLSSVSFEGSMRFGAAVYRVEGTYSGSVRTKFKEKELQDHKLYKVDLKANGEMR